MTERSTVTRKGPKQTKWVLATRYMEETGHNADAIDHRKRRFWQEGVHWKKGPDRRLYVNPQAIDEWIENAN